VVTCLARGALGPQTGVFNLTGDGVMTLREIASAMGRRYVALPTRWVQTGLRALERLDLAPYGPEQTLFLEHRPVLSNARLKSEFGLAPRQSSREVFEAYRATRA
jgi:UDP-glucose 4-epimerase